MAKQRIRLQGMLIFLGVLLVIATAGFIIPRGRTILVDTLLDITGLSLVLIGFLFRLCARGYKQEHSSQSQELVTSGPYSCVRNPMYFGTLLIGCGVIVMLLALWALPVFLVSYLLIYVPEVKKEEAKLREHFGQVYIDYCARTSRFSPKLSSLWGKENIFSLKFIWIKKELPSLVLVVGSLFLVEIIEDVSIFGWQHARAEVGKLAVLLLVFFGAAMGLINKSKNK
jgi:protein-S-isoprenylcysteine O-methyltransferase Ste14